MQTEHKKADTWRAERRRILYLMLAAAVVGLFTSQWLLSFLVIAVLYIAWLLYKLEQLKVWIQSGSRSRDVPDSDGIWEQIVYQIQSSQKISQNHKKKLSRTLRRMEDIISGLPYAALILNENNEITWLNNNATTLLQLDVKRDLGQRIDNIFRVYALHQMLRDGEQGEIEVNAPYDSDVSLTIHVITLDGGLKMLLARDVSERVMVQRMRKNFIANASHELKTPLTVVSGYLEMLNMERETLSDAQQSAITAATEQSDRMQSLINDLLTLSLLESKELDVGKSQWLSLANIIDGVIAGAEPIAKAHSFDLSRIDRDLKVKGVETELYSLCSNLINNAVRYTPKETLVTIVWELGQQSEGVFSVTDDGDGIEASHLSHLTERFYRVDKGRSQDMGGTGLGLSIVQHISQRHQARLHIDSEVGVGTTFEVTFPASSIQHGQDETPQQLKGFN